MSAMMPMKAVLAMGAGLFALAACGQPADETGQAEAPAVEEPRVVNIYSARHYSSDEAIYAAFTEETGIEINLVEAGGDLLIERVRTDGERSPADIVITVDAGRLERAEEAGLFQPVGDLGGALDGVPDYLKHPEGYWFGFATRARVIAYSTERVDPGEITTYDDIADPAFAGRVCVRSSDNVYNQSLIAGMIAARGEAAAEAFAQGIADNLARPPQGGDSDQIRAIAAGECDVAIVNHYYYLRIARSDDPADREVAAATDIVFPSLGEGLGTHVNVSGAGLGTSAPNPAEARAFMRFLLSPQAQRVFAELTNEFPAVPGTAYDNETLAGYDGFAADTLNVSELGENNVAAQRIFDRVGWP